MSQLDTQASNPYASFGASVADAPAGARVDFIRKTYTHLAVAIYAFAGLEWVAFSNGWVDAAMTRMQAAGNSNMVMLILFGGFIGVSWIANKWARSETSVGLQYAGLFLYVLFEAIFFAPLLWMAQWYAIDLPGGQEVSVIAAAGVATLAIFGGLTAFVWITRKDFSFLGAGLGIASMAAMALIVVGYFMGLNLGVWFSVAMVALAAGYILYDTSNVMNQYRPGQHVAAALALFASVALLFWYILRIFMALSSRD